MAALFFGEDLSNDGKINLADAIFLLNYAFKSGDEPPAPGPHMDGPDTTPDPLDCGVEDEDCPNPIQ